jgi:hypothetical protein
MSNPFLSWLPMYAPEAVPERPWWRVSRRSTYQIGDDGNRISGSDCRRPDGGEEFAPEAATATVLDAYDAKHPLPVPPPMAGQVWCDTTARNRAQVQFTIHAVIGDVAIVIVDDTGPSPIEWPPPAAVLVAGPTPWGRDVPWAPAGWKP